MLNWMIAPIHAAIWTNNVQILKEILDIKGVDIDIVATFKNEDQKFQKYGALDMVTLMMDGEEPDIDIVKLILNNMKKPFLHHTVSGISPNCIIHFVNDEALEVLDLVHSKADQFDTLNPLDTLAVSIWRGKLRVYNHVLPQAEKYFDNVVVDPPIEEWKSFTKKEMLVNLAMIYAIDMSEQFQRAVGYMDGNNAVKESTDTKGDNIVNEVNVDEVKDYNVAKSDNIVDEVQDSNIANGGDIFDELKDSNIANGDDIDDEAKDSNVAEGDDINSEEDEMTKYCWSCFDDGKYKCSGCRKARYCGESCQKSDRSRHMDYCLVMNNKIAFRKLRCLSPSIFT